MYAQGAGAYIRGGTVSFISCQIDNNKAVGYVNLLPLPGNYLQGPPEGSFQEAS